ncbi:PH domain-containing protein (plasmid) [Staphylococcus epidermidis]|uniref:PH domain-containing protein n=1 Tax=Staphylococcus epidermidis TaxID=1282 RepID=UPI0024AD20A6|nr:PH domain-containing protein [Staphylococcus epidermidis]WHI82636.1 PH domain-containing protein [Staphylococcus epidermidis]
MVQQDNMFYKLSNSSLKYMRLIDTIILLVSIFFMMIFTAFKILYVWENWWNSYILISIVLFLIIIFGLIEIILIDKYHQKNYSISMNNRYIELNKVGILKNKRTVIPISKIQHIDIVDTPILKKYKLSSMKISTIAYTHELPALKLDQVKKIHDFISLIQSSNKRSSVIKNDK